MRIVQLATEFAPLIKVGGLGEVLVGLSRELVHQGHQVEVILPKYDLIDCSAIAQINKEMSDFKTLENGIPHTNAMWAGTLEECPLRLLEMCHPKGYFQRGTIYGCEDDIDRFLYFSRAAVDYLKLKNEPIDILHLHDWHVAVVAVLAKELFSLPIRSILLTIHNGEYQGRCSPWNLDAIGLAGTRYLTPDRLQDDDPAYPQTLNLLKGGIVYADVVNAVSPTYAQELLQSKAGFYLDQTTRKHKEKVFGILNGIDLKRWNPGSDPALPQPYSKEDSLETILRGKTKAREEICRRFSLSSSHRPWVGSIGRLVPQKGPKLIEEGLRQTIAQGGTFLLLGSATDPSIEAHFQRLQASYEGDPRVLTFYQYDEELSHQIYAALDFLLIPSEYEPCGLTQLIAMRYGTVPIVRATGGLKDTIFDWEDPAVPLSKRNGFSFEKAQKKDLTAALTRAIAHFRSDRASFQRLIQKNMNLDVGWKKPTQEYIKLYRRALSSSPAKKQAVC